MASIKTSGSAIHFRHAVYAYVASISCLLIIFLRTMVIHYDGRIDWPYLAHAFPIIGSISFCPAILVFFAKISKWYWSVPFGIVIGFLGAVLFVSLLLGI